MVTRTRLRITLYVMSPVLLFKLQIFYHFVYVLALKKAVCIISVPKFPSIVSLVAAKIPYTVSSTRRSMTTLLALRNHNSIRFNA